MASVLSVRDSPDELWALKDVSFEVKRGEVLGIIGRNGAGKSTLLKILSRITEPTSGRAILRGRVGSLLEVGTGFHPELTGRENIFLNGAILGMKRREIAAKFDEIVAFAEVEQFIDTPVKRYSSGMYVRLAFAVAAHLDPEILLVDEVLAVGDIAFQKKCLGKMGDIAHQGRTVLFVSHNMAAMGMLCSNAVLMDGGRLRMQEETDSVIQEYLTLFGDRKATVDLEHGEKEAYFTRVELRNDTGQESAKMDARKPFRIRLEYALSKPIAGISVYFSLYNQHGLRVFTCFQPESPDEAGHYVGEATIPSLFLAPGAYTVSAGMFRPNIRQYDACHHVLGFSIIDIGIQHHISAGRDMGCVLANFPWTTERIV